MSDIEYRKTVKDESKFKCDVCRETKVTLELQETIDKDSHSKLDICSACHKNLPSKLIESLYTGEPRWKADAAREIIYSIRECTDAMNYDDFTINDMKEGVWAVFGNGEAESYHMEELVSMEQLESRARDNEFHYRDFPRYLEAVSDNGKLKQFKTEWKLVEVIEE